LDISLGEEEAWELGLTCGGAVSVFVELVQDEARQAFAEAQQELAAGNAVRVITLLLPEPKRIVLAEGSVLSLNTGGDDEFRGALGEALDAGVSARVTG